MEDEPKFCMCTNVPTDDWRMPIIEFLKMGALPSNRGEAQKLKLHVSHYTLVGELLAKFHLTLLKVPVIDRGRLCHKGGP